MKIKQKVEVYVGLFPVNVNDKACVSINVHEIVQEKAATDVFGKSLYFFMFRPHICIISD